MKYYTNKHLLVTAFSLSIFFIFTAFQIAPVNDLKITVTGIKNSKGEINFNLYNTAEGFPKDQAKAFKRLRAKITDGKCTVTFDNIPLGEYAVAAYHDENDNGRFDKNFFGKPTEGAAISNDAKGSISGPPSFDKAKFNLNTQTKMLIIKMNYY